jgi:hypothetical protein
MGLQKNNKETYDNSRMEGKYMKYTIGDTVRFKLESGEVQEGNIQFIEKNRSEETFYINSFSNWAYKVSGRKIIT